MHVCVCFIVCLGETGGGEAGKERGEWIPRQSGSETNSIQNESALLYSLSETLGEDMGNRGDPDRSLHC